MKILVPVKRVVDYNVRVKAKLDGSGVDIAGVKMSINPFDEIAVEEAIRLKEKGIATEVIVASIGVAACSETIRHALALGADRGIHVAKDSAIEPLQAAKILCKIVRDESPQIVICGKQAIDDDANQTGQMLAALLGWGQATFAYRSEITATHAIVIREVDGGLATIKLPLPCIITTDLRLNEPRYATMPNIMKAKAKPIKSIPVADTGVDITPRTKSLNYAEPAKRSGGIRVSSVSELMDKLTEAKVI